jgi:hypothetical protein
MIAGGLTNRLVVPLLESVKAILSIFESHCLRDTEQEEGLLG